MISLTKNAFAYIHTLTQIHTHTPTQIHTHTHKYTHRHTHTYTYIYIYIYIYRNFLFLDCLIFISLFTVFYCSCFQHNQHNKDERTHFLRKIYLLHFIWNSCERVMGERWVGDRTKTATYWPPVPPSLAALLSRSAGLLIRSAESWFSLPRTATPDSKLCWLQLTELPFGPGYIIVWHPPASCEGHICTQLNPSTIKVIPWYYLPTPPLRQDMTQGQFLSGV